MMNMASGMTLDDLEGENPKRYFIDSSSTKATNIFTYQQSIGIFVKNRQKIFEKKKNGRHTPILRKSMVILGTFSAIVSEFSQN